MMIINKKKLIQIYWLILAVICVVSALICWFITDKKMLYQMETPIEVQVIEEVTAEKVATSRTLGAFQQEVPPLELNKRKIALSHNHLAEFRGTTFIQKNAKMWTIELFRAKEESVVISYFRHHPDQTGLFYTRLSGDEQEDMYVVFYKTFKTQTAAQQEQLDLSALSLPASVTPAIYQLKSYAKLVNEVGSDESLSGFNKVPHIRLSSVSNFSSGSSIGDISMSPRNMVTPMVAPATRIVRHSQETIRPPSTE